MPEDRTTGESDLVLSEIVHIRSPLGTRYAGHVVLVGTNDWQHPWLRIQLVLRTMLTTRWDHATWRRVRLEIPKALAEKHRIEQEGWLN